MSEQAGGINVYRCGRCGWKAITRNRDEGTTPFLIRCEGLRCDGGDYPGCPSCFYRVPQDMEPTYEWYRPTSAGERRKLDSPAVRDHVERGGLLLRRIETCDCGADNPKSARYGHSHRCWCARVRQEPEPTR